MRTFLEECIEKILEDNDEISKLQIILPSKRACGFFKHYLKQKIDKATFLPSIISIEEFIERIADLQIVSSRRLLLFSYTAYLQTESIPKKDDFETFSGWIAPLLGDLNEIDRHLVDTKAFFDYLLGIKTLENWNASDHQTDLIKNYLAFWKSLPEFYQNLHGLLQSQGLGHQGMVYRKASEELEHYIRSNPNSQYCFIGFNALNKAEQHLIKELAETGNSRIFWDADRAFFNDQPHAASHFMRSYFSKWKHYRRGWPKLYDNYSQPKVFNMVQSQQAVSQAKIAGQILSGLSEVELNKTAVVLADEQLLVPLLHSLPDRVKQVNVTMGVPLSRFPLTDFFKSLFYLHSKNEDSFYYRDLFPVLKNPMGRRVLHSSEKIMANAAHNNLAYISLRFILDNCYEQEQDLSRLLFGPWKGSARKALLNLRQIVNRIKSIDGLSKVEKVVLYEIHKVLDEVESAAGHYDYLGTAAAIMLLFEDAVANSTVDFMGDAYNGLQIMGVLETRTLDFENIVMLSVNEGTLPAGKSSPSFLTYDLKKAFDLPMYDEKDAVYGYHFYRLLQRARNCWFIYNGTAEGLETGEKSRFLLQIETEQRTNHRINQVVSRPKIELHKHELLQVDKTSSVNKKIAFLKTKGLSPSALTAYIRNPIDFYFRYVLEVQQQDLLEEVVEYTTLGTIVHNSLEQLYLPLVGQLLSEKSLNGLLLESDKRVVLEFDALFKRGNYRKGKNLLIFEVAKKYVENLIKWDLERVKKGAIIQLLAVEKKLSAVVELPGLTGPCTLKGTVDRIERVNEVIHIIDYKTGAVSPGDLNISEWENLVTDYKYSKAFQVLLYAYLYWLEHKEPQVLAGIISFKSMGQGFMPFGKKKTTRNTQTPVTEEILQSFTGELSALIAEIMDPTTPFIEKEV